MIAFIDGSCLKKDLIIPIAGIGIYFPNKEFKDVSLVYPHHKFIDDGYPTA